MIEAIFDLVNNACKSQYNIEKELSYSQKLRKHSVEYIKSSRIGKLGRLKNKEKGDLIHWYETVNIDKETNETYSTCIPEPENVNLNHYKDRLLSKLNKTLEIIGFDIKKLS